MKIIDLKYQIIIDSAFKDYSLLKIKAVIEDDGFLFTNNSLSVDAKLTLQDQVKIPLKDKLELIDVKKVLNMHPFFYLQKCESPIELKFFVYALDSIPELQPQVQIDGYRVDFAVPSQKVLIELDGHEFHKTKEQRTYDAKRDRFLLKKGWRLMRFTGTEIHNDTTACIQEVKDYLSQVKSKN